MGNEKSTHQIPTASQPSHHSQAARSAGSQHATRSNSTGVQRTTGNAAGKARKDVHAYFACIPKRFLATSRPLVQRRQGEQSLAPSPWADQPLNPTKADPVSLSVPLTEKTLGSMVLIPGSVPALISIHGQSAFGDSTYRPKMGHVWDFKPVTLRPGLLQQQVSADMLESGSTEEGWTQVSRGRRVRTRVPNHSAEDINVFSRCSEVDQSQNAFYSTKPRPAIVVGVSDGLRKLTLVALTSFSGEGLAKADRFTKLVAYPVSGAAGPHETFDYDERGQRVPIKIEPVNLGYYKKYYKDNKEVGQWILTGVPFVVDADNVEPYDGGRKVSPDTVRVLRETILAHTSAALAQQMHLGTAPPSLMT